MPLRPLVRPAVSAAAAALFAGPALAGSGLSLPVFTVPADTAALAITAFTIAMWATGLLPEYLTALIFFTLVMLTGAAPPEVAFAGFASSALWMIFAGLVLGVAMEHCGLARRLAVWLAAGMGRSYGEIIGGVVLFAVGLSFLMPSAMGRVVLMAPIIAALADRFGFPAGSRGRTGILLAAALAAFLPAFGILPSNVPNMVLAGAAEAMHGIAPTYGAWLILHFPILGLAKAVLIFALITRLYQARPAPAAAVDPPAPWTTAERRLAVLLGLGLMVWATDFVHHLAPAWVGMVMGIVCLLPGSGLLPERAFPARINLAPLFYVAGIISLGALINHTGLGARAAHLILAVLPLDPAVPAMSAAGLTVAAIGIGLFATLPGIPAVLTPLAPDLAAAAGLPLMTVLMCQVPGFSTVLFPYQSPPLMVALRISGVDPWQATRMLLLLAVITVTVLLPLDYLWARFLGWL